MHEFAMDFKLKPRQHRALLILLHGGTQREAAEAAGVNEATIWRWRQREEFRRALSVLQHELEAAALGELKAGKYEAARELRRLLRSDSVSDTSKLKAAQLLLEPRPTAAVATDGQQPELIVEVVQEASTEV